MSDAAKPDRSAEYLLVRELREQAARISQNIGESTQRDYAKKYERMMRTGMLPENAGTKKAYYAYRAALLHGAAAEVRQALRKRDQAPYGNDAWRSAMEVLERCRNIFARYPPDPERRHYEKGSASFTWEQIRSHKVRTMTGWSSTIASKKRLLSKLRKVHGWRENLFAQVTEKHKAAAAICALTGARPSEIARGVRIELKSDGTTQFLLISINGSKLTATTGQPERILRIKIDSVEAQHLAAIAATGAVVVGTHPANFCAAIIKAGRKAFPSLRETVSPYVFRHSLASDMKAAGIAPRSIAQVLGHQASESQQAYGFAVCSCGVVSIEAVRASIPIRMTHRNPRNRLRPADSAPTLG